MLTLLMLDSGGVENRPDASKIFLILTKSVFKNVKRGVKWSTSKSSYIQVLPQQITGCGGGGSKCVLIALTQAAPKL